MLPRPTSMGFTTAVAVSLRLTGLPRGFFISEPELGREASTSGIEYGPPPRSGSVTMSRR